MSDRSTSTPPQPVAVVGRAGPAGRRAALRADLRLAAEIVAPAWPLTSFVAVDPLVGLHDRSFAEATALARRWLGARTHLPPAELRRRHAAGEITDHHLTRAVLEVRPDLAAQPPVMVDGRRRTAVEALVADLVHGPVDAADGTSHGVAAGAAVDPDADLVATWCAAFVDQAGAAWPMGGRGRGFYRTWRDLAPHDPRLRRVLGRPGRAFLVSLPDRADDAVAVALEALDVTDERRVDALRAQIVRLPGWAGHARWRDSWAAEDEPGPALHLLDLVAVLVVLDAARRRAGSGDADVGLGRVPAPPATPDADAGAAATHGPPAGDVETADRAAIWLRAHELAVRGTLLDRLTPPVRAESAQPAAPAEVQVVCCIDVRSEGLRRHLEAVDGARYDTYGFAGFFGVAVRWHPLGVRRGQARAPVIVTPRHDVVEQASGPDDRDTSDLLADVRRRRAVGATQKAVKGHLAAPFVFAEAAGWLTGPLALGRTLRPARSTSRAGRWTTGDRPRSERTRPASPAEAGRVLARVGVAAEAAGPEAAGASGVGLTLQERIATAGAVLAAMGMVGRLGRLVVLCGHGSTTRNNPHASSLDCGACGGAPGGASARVAAAILNDPAVRDGLAAGGVHVPADTWFVAAEHDTTSDRVRVLDRDLVPTSHLDVVTRFEADVEVAGAALAQERARRLPGRATRVRDRGHDWAQTRPEWGLAGNAAFVVGPRGLTAGLDLAGRAFLHTYHADADPDGVVLEAILTGPLLVAQWISAQYYFSAVDPDRFGAGDKLLHNPVGGVGVTVGDGGDLRIGLPWQSVACDGRLVHDPVRLLALVQAPLLRIEEVLARAAPLRTLLAGDWLTLAGRDDASGPWSVRSPGGTWATWHAAPVDEEGA